LNQVASFFDDFQEIFLSPRFDRYFDQTVLQITIELRQPVFFSPNTKHNEKNIGPITETKAL